MPRITAATWLAACSSSGPITLDRGPDIGGLGRWCIYRRSPSEKAGATRWSVGAPMNGTSERACQTFIGCTSVSRRRAIRLLLSEFVTLETVSKAAITLSYEEALYIADLLAVAADAASNDESVPDTFPDEARLAINLILSRTDD